MKNTPQLFAFEQDDHLASVRVIPNSNGDIWFVANDVCAALEIANPRNVIARLDEDEKGVHTMDTLGGKQELNCINESGLYSLILTSRKDSAKRFKKWVTSEVLPSIRKTGGYQQPQLDANRIITAQKHSYRLLQQICETLDPAVQHMLYEDFVRVRSSIGASSPALQDIVHGNVAPEIAGLLEQFFANIASLLTQNVQLNHSRNGRLLAVNLQEYQRYCKHHQLTCPSRTELCAALKQSPALLGNKTVNSAISDTSVKCWVFQRSSFGVGGAV